MILIVVWLLPLPMYLRPWILVPCGQFCKTFFAAIDALAEKARVFVAFQHFTTFEYEVAWLG
jgi:hypothetical protein